MQMTTLSAPGLRREVFLSTPRNQAASIPEVTLPTMLRFWRSLPVLLRALLAGAAVATAGTMPWAALSLANQRYLVAVPWAVPIMAIYLWLLWRWLRGDGAPASTSADRKASLRARAISPDLFVMTVFAGILGFVSLIPFTILLGRLVTLNAARPITLPPGMPSSPRSRSS